MAINAYGFSDTEQATIKKLINYIEWKDNLEYLSGSCGDGNFDSKMKEQEHKEKQTAIRVITQFVL